MDQISNSELLLNNKTTSDEAISNIEKALKIDMSPDYFAKNKEQLSPLLPNESPEPLPNLKNFMSQSEQHASTVKDEIEHMNKIEKIWNSVVQGFGPKSDAIINVHEKTLKKLFSPQDFSEDEELDLFENYDKLQKFPQYVDPTDILESAPGEIATTIGTISKIAGDNAKTIAAATGVGALIGGGLGSLAAPVTGGGSTVAGVKYGAALGLSLSAQGTIAVNGALLTATSLFNDVTYDPESPDDLDVEVTKYVALGTGAVTGGFDLVGGRGILKAIPGLKNLVGKEAIKKIILDPQSEAVKRGLMTLGKAVAGEGMTEVVQELVTIVGEATAKNKGDIRQVSLEYVLEEAGKNDRLLKAGVVGSGTALTLAGPLTSVNISSNKAEIIKTNEKLSLDQQRMSVDGPSPLMDLPISRSIKVLETQSKIAQLIDLEKQSKLFKISDQVYSQFRNKILMGTDLKIFADIDDIRNYAGEDLTKQQQVETILGISLTDETTAPIQLNESAFFKMVHSDENFLEVFRQRPDGESAAEARNYLKSLDSVKQKSAEILKKLGVEGLAKEDREQLLKQLSEIEDPVIENPYSDESYLNRPTFTEAVEKLLGEKTSEKVIHDINDVRKTIADITIKAKEEQIDRIVSIDEQVRLDEQYDFELSKLQNDQKYDIVDKFTSYKTSDFIPTVRGKIKLVNPDEILKNHEKPGRSPFAIDPKFLSSDLKYFLKNKRLKDYKVFVKGGITPEESAALLGYRTPKRLLNDLVNTPTREELAQKRVEISSKRIKDESFMDLGPTKQDYLEAFSDFAKNNLKDMDLLFKTKLPTSKKVIKTFAKRTPKQVEIVNAAKRIVSNLKVSEMNPKKFEAGMTKARKIAIDSLLDGDLFKASKALEQGALNAETAKLSYQTMRKLNKAFKFISKFRRDETMSVIIKAGPLYENAVNEILDNFNFDPSRKNTSERDSFAIWVRDSIDRLEGNFEIPEKFSDIRESANELTVDQVLTLAERLANVLHTARYKNKLKNKYKIENMILTLDSISQVVNERLSNRSDYDLTKVEPYAEGNTLDSIQRGINTFFAMHRRVESIVKGLLDKNEANGFFYNLIWEPLNRSRNEKQLSIEQINEAFIKFKDDYGAKDWENLNSITFEIPEFGNRTYSKADLIMIMMNMGNQGNIDAVKRIGADEVTIWQVLERHLDQRDADIVQKVLDTFEFGLKPKVQEFLKRTEGVEPEWVEAKGFNFKGNSYRGGYFPLFYETDSLVQTSIELQGLGTQKDMTNFFQKNYYAQTMTKNGHLIEREGSKAKLDLSLQNISKGIENVLHDVHFRNALRDVSLILGHEPIQRDIVATIGIENYNQMKLWLMEISKNGEHLGNESEKWWNKVFQTYKRSSQLQRLGLKLSTFLVQTVSLPIMFRNLAKESDMVKAAQHFGDAWRIMTLNPSNFDTIISEISNYSPELKQRYKNLDINAETTLNRTIAPYRRKGVWNSVERFQKNVEDLSFGPLSKMSLYLNSTMWIASYKQAMNGDVKNIKAGDILKSREYANSMIRLTLEANDVLDKSQIQNTKMLALFTEFYSQMNVLTNLYATSISEYVRSFSEANNITNPIEKLKVKTKVQYQFANDVIFFIILPKIIADIVRGNELPGDDEEAKEYLAKAVALEPLNAVISLRDISYAYDNEYGKGVGLPVINTFNDFLNVSKATVGYVSELAEGDVYEPSTAEKRSMVRTFGFATRLFPGDMTWQVLNIELPEVLISPVEELINDAETLLQKSFIPEAAAEDLEDIILEGRSILPKNANEPVMPEEYYDTLAQIESSGKWYAKNPESSATGLYQFTESTWEDIRRNAPELGLTKEGRYDDNTEEQERAIRWLTEDNVKRLTQSGISPSMENVYAAHFLGLSDSIKVLRASPNDRLSTLVDEKVIRSNPFLKDMTAADFKTWLEEKIDKAIEQIDKVIE